MTTFAEIKNEIAKRKPEELPVVLVDPESGVLRRVIGFYGDRVFITKENDSTSALAYLQPCIEDQTILPPPKKEKVLYQAVFSTKHFPNEYHIPEMLFESEEAAKNWQGAHVRNFKKLLTDRPIKLEE